MKKVLLLAATLLALTASLLGACRAAPTNRMTVVTSTSLLSYIVEQVGGNHVEAINMVPPNQHPGNFDVKPGDIEKLSSAALFILHGWPGEGYADKLVASANNPGLTVVKANVNGNWMIPSVQSAAADRVAEILGQADVPNAAAYTAAAAAYKQRIQKKETQVQARLAGANVSQISLIASVRQADFLQWAGFKVVATFVDAQSLTPQAVQTLIDQGRAAGIKAVVNNLQDGKDAGKAVAAELGVTNVNLSNFPGGFDNTATWEKAIDYNVDLILKAVGK